MIDLKKAALIYSEIERIIKNDNSPYLTNGINHTSHIICKFMKMLNSESTLFYESNCGFKDFFSSLKIDGIEVIGYKKEYYRQNFFVDTETICSLANPAPFGKGSKTIYDENIRKAYEITYDRIKIKKTKEYNNTYDKIFNKLAPLDKKFNFKLYKMHIYNEGGKFEKHKDTLHATNHYATLIVGIGTQFKGGELNLYDNGEKINSWDFNS